jgi:hypothetical protein
MLLLWTIFSLPLAAVASATPHGSPLVIPTNAFDGDQTTIANASDVSHKAS